MRISRVSILLAVTVLILLAALISTCPRTEDTNSNAKPTAAPTQTAAQTISDNNSFASNVGDAFKQAEFPYSCKKDGKKRVATFDRKLLPRDNNVVVGAIHDVIGRCFSDKAESALRLEGVGAEQVIRIDGKKHGYIVVPIKEKTGEIHSLVITQVTD